ncbi:MAG: MerR family transcriptional regulator [Acidaminobacteraceae bacterium]
MDRKKLIKSEVVKLFNTSKETLRHYENKGLLKPEIDDNNYRLYDYNDLQKLREIFLLKDLGFLVNDMKKLSETKIDKNEYISMLEKHNLDLKSKIARLQNVSDNIEQLTDVLEKGDNNRSYLIRYENIRHFYKFDNIEEELLESPKNYYDEFIGIIEKSSYSERILQIIYDYENLSSECFDQARMCMELSSNDHMIYNQKYKDNILTLKSGKYLSIFYPYIEGKINQLPQFQVEIEIFLKNNNLVRTSDVVIEKEHPELSMFLEHGAVMFEIQISVGNMT